MFKELMIATWEGVKEGFNLENFRTLLTVILVLIGGFTLYTLGYNIIVWMSPQECTEVIDWGQFAYVIGIVIVSILGIAAMLFVSGVFIVIPLLAGLVSALSYLPWDRIFTWYSKINLPKWMKWRTLSEEEMLAKLEAEEARLNKVTWFDRNENNILVGVIGTCILAVIVMLVVECVKLYYCL